MNKEKETTEIEMNYIPAKVKQEHLQKLETTATDFYGICKKNDLSPITAIRRASAMQTLRDLLTPEIMAPVMSLQGNPLGFKTDRDLTREKDENNQRKKGPGYPVEIVRDTFIYATGKGARMINNEVNIIAANPYLTKNFFFRMLDEVLGAENWKITHEIPRVVQSNGKTGAIVKSKIWWRDSKSNKDGKTQELEFAIKGDDYASSDSYTGKADRKAGNWLLQNITGERFLEGEVDDAIDIKAINVTPSKSIFEKRADAKNKKEVANEVVDTTAVHLEKEDKIPMESHPKSETSASDIPINIGHLEGYFRAQGMLPFTQPISARPELLQKVRENLSQYVDLVNEWKEQNGIKN